MQTFPQAPRVHAGTCPATLIQSLFSPGTVAECGRPRLIDDQLWGDELASIANAVPKRRAEFGMVRVCARHALSELGVEPTSLAPFPDRSPRWPGGIVGSLTHTSDYCAAIVARATRLRAIGLDAEDERYLEPALVEMILTPRERRALSQLGEPANAIVYFSAKEAFYKCQYPLTQTFLDFLDVELDVDFDRGTYTARVVKSLRSKPEWMDRTTGRFLRQGGLVVCGSEVRADR